MNPSIPSPLLFLGAPGLIGNQVIPVLIEAGFSVLAGSRRRLSVGGAPGVGVDMRDPASLARAMHGMAASFCFSSASCLSKADTYRRKARHGFSTDSGIESAAMDVLERLRRSSPVKWTKLCKQIRS